MSEKKELKKEIKKNKKSTKEDLKAQGEKSRNFLKNTIADFKKFIARGNILDLSVGVVIGGAFGAIVTAFTNILLSVCTWGVPGGLKGLVTPLPALNAAQSGVGDIGQHFAAANIADATIKFAASQNVVITTASDTFVQWQNALLGKYTLYGTEYYFNGTAIINWGAFINAVITFLIIALVLFTIVKVVGYLTRKREEYRLATLEKWYKLHPEERPAPVKVEKKPTELELLTQIRDIMAKANPSSEVKDKIE